MSGARLLAVDHLKSMVWKGAVVLDLGAGDGEISELLRRLGADVQAVDLDHSKGHGVEDATDTPWRFKVRQFDAVVACYSLQHMLGDEAAIWREIRRSLKPDGVFISTGRYKEYAPSFEMERGDPLRQDNESTLIALAQASGLRLSRIETYRYTENAYVKTSTNNANAFAAIFKRAGAHGLTWTEACQRYRLLDVEGWMDTEELRYLYETAKAMGGGTIVEIGSFMGRSTCAILAGLAEGRGGRLIAIDPFTGKGTVRAPEVAKNGGPDWLRGKLVSNIKSRSLPMPIIYTGDADHEDIFTRFRPESIDWIFIDGEHTLDGVSSNLGTWVPRVKRDGLITGHDYHETWSDVVKAVDGYFSHSSDSPKPFRNGYTLDVVHGTTIWRVRG